MNVSNDLHFNLNILEKYNTSGPRYTSYPTAPQFKNETSPSLYIKHLALLGNIRPPLSLYFHIPFCISMCHYCGCNVAIRKDRVEYGDHYLDHLFQEIEMLTRITGRIPINQCHWGGGTPTFLNVDQITRLYSKIKESFEIQKNAEIAIEIEPRTVTEEQISCLARMGFNRISMGVQDMDIEVGRAINRVNTYDNIASVFSICRSHELDSINIDLIYGLPKQTESSFKQTMEGVIKLKPSRIALYSFAYVPWLKRHQKNINQKDLPNPSERIELFKKAREVLLNNGYISIAMDHFARKEDPMAKSFLDGSLNRNFMGYTLLPGEDYLGIGASSIGYIRGAYFQNHKHLPEYYKSIQNGLFPLEKSYCLDRDDIIRKWVIQQLMCSFELNYDKFNTLFDLSFRDYFKLELERLEDFYKDKLIIQKKDSLVVTESGKLLIRNICMIFDRYITENQSARQFSKTI